MQNLESIPLFRTRQAEAVQVAEQRQAKPEAKPDEMPDVATGDLTSVVGWAVTDTELEALRSRAAALRWVFEARSEGDWWRVHSLKAWP